MKGIERWDRKSDLPACRTEPTDAWVRVDFGRGVQAQPYKRRKDGDLQCRSRY